MTAMTDEKRVSDDRLRQIIAGCEGVTPGRWAVLRLMSSMIVTASRSRICQISRWDEANARHIARLDPQTVTAICEELLSRRSHQEGWRPIETAPKDGTCIYLAWNSEDWTMAEGMWRGDEWVTSATFYNPDLPHPRMEFREYRPNNPLWWQPLPAAPSPEEGK
jgi:hypothetical protein